MDVRKYFRSSAALNHSHEEGYGLGRGYPDISQSTAYRVGKKYVNGYYTKSEHEQSGSVISLITNANKARIILGKGSLGWINPLLYKKSSVLLIDVLRGNNHCGWPGLCCSHGFYATPGWDPTTGLGSLSGTKLETALVSLGSSFSRTHLESKNKSLGHPQIRSLGITIQRLSPPRGSKAPTMAPLSRQPTSSIGFITFPSSAPTTLPSTPSSVPSYIPNSWPSTMPSTYPSSQPTTVPSMMPTGQPTSLPSSIPSGQPSGQPTSLPSSQPSGQPSGQPTSQPSSIPSGQPSGQPTSQPSDQPSSQPSGQPSAQPSSQPSDQPSGQPSTQPSSIPTGQPSGQPSGQPTAQLISQPTGKPTGQPTSLPSSQPTEKPTGQPTSQPITMPTGKPSVQPTSQPTGQPSMQPSNKLSCCPTSQPSHLFQYKPTATPTLSSNGSADSLASLSAGKASRGMNTHTTKCNFLSYVTSMQCFDTNNHFYNFKSQLIVLLSSLVSLVVLVDSY